MNFAQPIYYIPIILFLVISLSMYFLEKDSTKKNKSKFIFIRVVLPAVTVALLSVIIIKYKDSQIFSNEPIMEGNYFEPSAVAGE